MLFHLFIGYFTAKQAVVVIYRDYLDNDKDISHPLIILIFDLKFVREFNIVYLIARCVFFSKSDNFV